MVVWYSFRMGFVDVRGVLGHHGFVDLLISFVTHSKYSLFSRLILLQRNIGLLLVTVMEFITIILF